MNEKVLIVIDMQNDFVTGSLGTPEAQAIVENVKNKIKLYESNGDTVFFTQDTHLDEEYFYTHEGMFLPVKHCIFDEWGWQICDGLNEKNHVCLCKGSFAITGWSKLRFVDEVEIIGLCTDVCVISNALVIRSTYPGIDITVDASCCAGTNPEKHKAALKVMRSCDINVIGD